MVTAKETTGLRVDLDGLERTIAIITGVLERDISFYKCVEM